MIYAYLYKKTRPIQRVKKYNIYMFEENISKFPISKQEFSRLKVFHNVCYESVIGYLLHSSIDEVEQGFVLIDPSKTDKKLVVLLEGNLKFTLIPSRLFRFHGVSSFLEGCAEVIFDVIF
jgi:hypothetical protein